MKSMVFVGLWLVVLFLVLQPHSPSSQSRSFVVGSDLTRLHEEQQQQQNAKAADDDDTDDSYAAESDDDDMDTSAYTDDDDDDDGVNSMEGAKIEAQLTSQNDFLLESINLPRILVGILGMKQDSSIERIKTQVHTWGTVGNIHVVVVAAGITLQDLNIEPGSPMSKRVSFLEMEPMYDTPGKHGLYIKVLEMFREFYAQYVNDFDFFMKIDDDTYINPISLQAMLKYYNYDIPVYLGRRVGTLFCHNCRSIIPPTFTLPEKQKGWHFYHGGGGYLLSSNLLKRWGEKLHRGSCKGYDKDWEDATVSICLTELLDIRRLGRRQMFDPFHNEAGQSDNWRQLVNFAKESTTDAILPSFLIHVSYHSIRSKLGNKTWEMRNRQLQALKLDEAAYQRRLSMFWADELFNDVGQNLISYSCGTNLICATLMLRRIDRPAFIPALPSSYDAKAEILEASAGLWKFLRERNSPLFSVAKEAPWMHIVEDHGHSLALSKMMTAFEQGSNAEGDHQHASWRVYNVIMVYLNANVPAEEVKRRLGESTKLSLIIIVIGRTYAEQSNVKFVTEKAHYYSYASLLSDPYAGSALLVVQSNSRNGVYPPMHIMKSVIGDKRNDRVKPQRSFYTLIQRKHKVSPLYSLGAAIVEQLHHMFRENTHFVHVHIDAFVLEHGLALKTNWFTNKDIRWMSMNLFPWDNTFIPHDYDCFSIETETLSSVFTQFAAARYHEYRWFLLGLMNALPEVKLMCQFPSGVGQLALLSWPVWLDATFHSTPQETFLTVTQ
eukprot:m.17677 g.17677  ORF g.17677 m.17677 type:complete len:776 (-) comp4820_c0_seq1:335-2662(-)